VFIVPDGSLHLVSFAALPSTASRYLVETGPLIHYLSAERDLMASGNRPVSGGLLALGSPDFDQVTVPLPVTAPRSGSFGCVDFPSTQFDRLPGALDEVNEVVALWNRVGRQTSRLVGAAASEAAFKAEAPGHRVLHLATHGFFMGRQCDPALKAPLTDRSATVTRSSPLLLSGLILAGANQRDATPPGQEDGVLTAEEVVALNLSGVDWAVLSGCDTGIGEIRAGEGVVGLRRAFQIAGARTVIMSLWSVEDRSTRQWMAALYANRLVKNLGTAEAVREASLTMLRQRRATGVSTHPFYWAAFVAAGDWR
jgi:CHAT domain-containing protein